MLNSVITLQHTRKNIYVACEEMNFVWDECEALKFDRMWKNGKSLTDIAKEFDRDPDELLLLCIDRARRGLIKKRPGGLFGNTTEGVDGQ